MHGYIRGEEKKCNTCGANCEVWSRIVGYFRPIVEWNKGKKSEYKDRKEYLVEKKKEKTKENVLV